jgi:hypothetical protein
LKKLFDFGRAILLSNQNEAFKGLEHFKGFAKDHSNTQQT